MRVLTAQHAAAYAGMFDCSIEDAEALLVDQYEAHRSERARRAAASKSRHPRLLSALERISRDRWLLPSEFRRVLYRLARCCSASPVMTISSLVRKEALTECDLVGMLNGRPPLIKEHTRFRELVELVERLERRPSKQMNELALLEFIARKRRAKK